jgi:hypothetical protein
MAPVEVEESESAVVTGEAVEEDPASALCSLLESAMEDLLGVEHFDRGAAQLLRVLDQLRGAEDSMPQALLRREVQQCLCGALECASRSLQAKLNAWPGLLPLLLKAVRLTLAATKGGPSISGELRSALASLKADLQAQAEAMVALLQLKS